MNHDQDKPFLEAILDCIADGVFTVDNAWRITSFNRAAERITGVEAAHALGKRCSDVFHADICERGCALAETMNTGQELIDRPARILNSSGRSVPVSLSTAVLHDPDGKLLGAVETFRDLSALEQLRREIANRYTFEDIVGKSEALKKVFALLPDIASSNATVLIEGPSGSGKELIARAVHNLSDRRDGPYVAVNSGALPTTLIESELFGYKQGAFTDAKRDKPGRIALAEGGTIFFDEVSELAPATQVKLLRVLQERQYEPLGATKTLRADVRVVAATNKRLAELVSQGGFRDDLYFRLAVVRITVPSLRERREDIPLLVEHFVRRFNTKRGKRIAGVTPEVMRIFMRHDWPGNVRELENAIEYGFVLCHDRYIDVSHLAEEYQAWAELQASSVAAPKQTPLQEAEAAAIRATLELVGGKVGQAAEALGISRATLWRRMKKYAISRR
ncbi:MAG: sigma 54-interacting transcriptional regulator [Deltaproteobacteria bacterium]|nr:sigma 54-interacting transcriptional regulator [Deltaproteobacteria bacterium]MBW2256191.1 sigma 54-interacting transcriptional regulator [Deltaproteobacteria bacterium]